MLPITLAVFALVAVACTVGYWRTDKKDAALFWGFAALVAVAVWLWTRYGVGA